MRAAVVLILSVLLLATITSAAKKGSGVHGDPCSVGCATGFNCNAAAGRCMATITAEMLQEARRKLKPVNRQSRPEGA